MPVSDGKRSRSAAGVRGPSPGADDPPARETRGRPQRAAMGARARGLRERPGGVLPLSARRWSIRLRRLLPAGDSDGVRATRAPSPFICDAPRSARMPRPRCAAQAKRETSMSGNTLGTLSTVHLLRRIPRPGDWPYSSTAARRDLRPARPTSRPSSTAAGRTCATSPSAASRTRSRSQPVCSRASPAPRFRC